MKIVLHWILISASVFAVTYILPGQIKVNPAYVALVVGACLMFATSVIEPIVKFFALPLNILTLGLFSVALHAAIFWGLTFVVVGFEIKTITAALLGAVIVWILNWILTHIL